MQENNHPPNEDQTLCTVEDGELLELYLRTDQSVYLAELARRHYPLVWCVASRQLNGRQDVEDAVQTVFFVLTKSAGAIRNKNSLAAWLYGVAFRTANRIRQQSKQFAKSSEDIPLEEIDGRIESPFSELARRMQLEVLDEELQLVREPYREVLVEHYLLGKSAGEIAQRFNLTQSTVEGRLRRGRKQLRTKMLSRGYSFASAVALIALPAKQLGADLGLTLDLVIASMSSSGVSGISSRVNLLAAEEMKMVTAFAGKFSGGMLATAAVATVVGLLSLSSFGNQIGRQAAREATLQATGDDASTDLDAMLFANYVAEPPADPADAGGAVSKVEPPRDVPSWAKKSSDGLRKKLEVMLQPDYPAVPLAQVLTSLADDLNIAIWLDAKQLELQAIDPDSPVTLNIPSVPLRQALKYMLSPLELSYRLEGDVLVVSTKGVIDGRPSLRAYDLSIFSESAGVLEILAQTLERNIRCIESAAWEDNVWNIQPMGQLLMVGTSEMVHGEIELMLTDLAQQLGKLPKQLIPAGSNSVGQNRPKAGASHNPASAEPFDPYAGAPLGNPFSAGAADRNRTQRPQGNQNPFGQSAPANSNDPFESGGAAENANPFGSGNRPHSRKDPFGGSAPSSSDPFGSNGTADNTKPLEGRRSEANNPFGGNDPFGTGPAESQPSSDNDPFGN